MLPFSIQSLRLSNVDLYARYLHCRPVTNHDILPSNLKRNLLHEMSKLLAS